jgi:hypothetical protein
MDHETMLLMARFSVQARRIVGTVHSNQLVADAEYRNNIFGMIDAQADEGLLMLSIALREKLSVGSQSTAANEALSTPTENPSKYKFGARG